MEKFIKSSNGFNYVYEKKIEALATVILLLPPVSSNKRGINDIGWQTDGDVSLYGTLSQKPFSETALWQEVTENDEINKTVSALKIVNNGSECNIVIRAILN